MSIEDASLLDDHIERLRGGDTLTENEVKALCDKVSEHPCLIRTVSTPAFATMK